MGSTLSFESGVPVSLGGTLELLLDAKSQPRMLAGTTFQLFDWSGVSPGGTFDEIAFEPDTTWDPPSFTPQAKSRCCRPRDLPAISMGMALSTSPTTPCGEIT